MTIRPPVYRKEALDKLTSPEQFDLLIQMTTYRSWMLLAGLGSVILIAVLWGLFGTLTQTTEQRGVLVADNPAQSPNLAVVLYVPYSTAKLLSPGMTARITPYTLLSAGTDDWQGSIQTVASQAATREEMVTVLGNALADSTTQLTEPVFEVWVKLDGTSAQGASRSLPSGTPCSVTITIKAERPISRIFPQMSGI